MAIKLSAPWIEYYRKVNAFFECDENVRVIYNDEEKTITLYVDGSEKASALDAILNKEITFGKITVKILVKPANKQTSLSTIQIENVFEEAFEGNEVLSYVQRISGIMTNDIIYVVFAKQVVQYFNDDLGDANGVCSTLYQNIANDIFVKQPNVYYCTDTV